MNEQQLVREAKIAYETQRVMDRNRFISLAEASRATKVPLTTLASAVKAGRLPAVRVHPKGWMVRVSAVEACFGNERRVLTQDQIDQLLMERGVIRRRDRPFAKPKPFKPIPIDEGGKTATELVIEGRRKRS